ncbi:MAG TPA: hypothetical protein VNF51_00230 [Candidatus Paceibacterota bacterium]|nr:hypothetical protein [Candidatus Paceibacterota bacterium]
MIRVLFVVLSFVSVIFFPWPLAALLALACAFIDPMVPLAVGLFADTLYYTPQVGMLPFFTLYGAAATLVAFFVRSRLRAGSIRK